MATIDTSFLESRSRRAESSGYDKPKWVEFCEAMLLRGYTVELREAASSVSKYLTIWNMGRKFTVRYSNHGATPIPGDPVDFFVGKNPKLHRTTNTQQAIEATIAALGESPAALTPKEE